MSRTCLLFLALIATATNKVEARAVKAKDNVGYNCIVRELKTLNMIDGDFPEHSGAVETGNCERIVDDAKQNIYTNVESALGRKDFYKYKKCMLDDLKRRRYAENTLKQSIYLNSETMSQEEMGLKINAIHRRNRNAVQDAMKLCMYSDMFGKLFDEIFDGSTTESDEDDDPIAEYCVRKYVVDSKLIDTKSYVVTLNPKNLDIESVNCKEHIETNKREILEMVEEALESDAKDETTSDCAKQRFLNAGFANKMMELAVLSELKLSAEKKVAERIRFIDFVASLIKSVVNC